MPADVIDPAARAVLKQVSRSFYLSLRLLPRPMRAAAGLGYLLARASDTIADAQAPADMRLEALDSFSAALADGGRFEVPAHVVGRVTHAGELRLLEMLPRLLEMSSAFPAAEADLLRRVVVTIVSGQRFDILRFGSGTGGGVVALEDEAELEEYTWRVAGCVGEFWTDLGFLTLGDGFSREDPHGLRALGISFGKGLQLVNILRDLPEDSARGRCYLPVGDPRDKREVLRVRDRFLPLAMERMDDGTAYARALETKRLRISAALPAMIGRETIRRMVGSAWEDLAARIKVPRSAVYGMLARALVGRFG